MSSINDLLWVNPINFWEKFFALSEEDQRGLAYEAKWRAGGWRTCACCMLKEERRVKWSIGEPINQRIEILGIEFYELISRQDYSNAQKMYRTLQNLVEEENKI